MLTLYTTLVVYLYSDRLRHWVNFETRRTHGRCAGDTPMKHTLVAALALVAALGGRAIGPDYQRLTWRCPASSRKPKAGAAEPRDVFQRAAWWELYGDQTLENDLQMHLERSNDPGPSRWRMFRQAEALRAAREPRSSRDHRQRGQDPQRPAVATAPCAFPTAPLRAAAVAPVRSATATRPASASAGRSTLGQAAPATGGQPGEPACQRRRPRRGARLSQQSQLAQNYLQLRVMDEQIRLLNDTATAYERSKAAENKYRAGITRADVAQARTQLKSTQAQAIDLKYQRAQPESTPSPC